VGLQVKEVDLTNRATLHRASPARTLSLAKRCKDSLQRDFARNAVSHLRGGSQETGGAGAACTDTAVQSLETQNASSAAQGQAPETTVKKKGPLRKMTRAHSEVTFPSMDSYAYTVETELGFSLFLSRRCKRIYFIGNAEGLHNTVTAKELLVHNGGMEFFDASLSPKGYEECQRLKTEILCSKHPLDFQLVVVSPLTRALQTAESALGDLNRATPAYSRARSRCISPQPEPLTMVETGQLMNQTFRGMDFLDKDWDHPAGMWDAHCKFPPGSLVNEDEGHKSTVAEDFSALHDKLMAVKLTEENLTNQSGLVGQSGSGSSKRSQRIPIIATDLCRERITGLPCDCRRSVTELKKEFPNVDFSLIRYDDDFIAENLVEDLELCRMRATRFLQWLCSRPEERIAVVSHSGFLTHLFSQFGMNKYHALARKDVSELRRRPLHAEMRGVLLAAHRPFNESELLDCFVNCTYWGPSRNVAGVSRARKQDTAV